MPVPFVLEKLRLLSDRKVVEFDVYSLVAQVLEPSKIIGRAGARKFHKVTDQMRLVEIPILQRNLFPCRLGQRIHFFQDTLKPRNSIK